MLRGPSGRFETGSTLGGESVRPFVPTPLPPTPPLVLDELRELIDQAHLALGRLDAITTLLPEPALFLYPYVRKEAVLSSQIEGTRSTLTDLLLLELDEAPGVPLDDTNQVLAYVRAMRRGQDLLGEGLPVCIRLLTQVHAVLLETGRGSEKTPGEIRRSQNWIGGARPGVAEFVPPPPGLVLDCLGDLDRFLNDQPKRTPTLIKAGLAHVQFETIHPFLDGNGRVGRLLIALLLAAEGLLKEPLLYLSLFFRQHRERYFELLQTVRRDGDWEAWLSFFLTGVATTAKQATDSAFRLNELFRTDRARIESIGRPASSALRVYHELMRHPIMAIPECARRTGMSEPTVASSMKRLESMGVLREITGKLRGRLYAYDGQLAILNEGIDD